MLRAPRGATLWFNYSNERTQRWADPHVIKRYGYRTSYPDGPTTGIVLDLDAKR